MSTGDRVVLSQARNPAERRLISAWARREHPDATVVAGTPDALGERLGADALLVPARISWRVPLSGNGKRRTAWRSLLARRPSVVAGEPATAAELRRRFTAEDSAESFPGFVVRAARLSCDRAERELIGDRYKVPRHVAEQILASARFREKAAALAGELGVDVAEVLDEARDCLTELAAVQSPAAIDAFRTVLAPMHASAWRVHVDEDSLRRVRQLGREHALVFLPAHRSYVDPLVLAEVLHNRDFPRNHVLGGNNMAFWPIGPLGKRAGVVFIRRSNAGDRVYKLALREYIGYLVAKRFNLEWYLEGGRSRTGKLRPPKVGLLAYLARALEDERAADIQLVPVSMIYDQQHEVGALADEQGGAKKGAEGLRWLARYVRGQVRNDGNARIRFGEPFSLAGALREAGDGPARLEKVAFRICDGINRATPVTATALVTFALLGTGDRAVTLEQVGGVTAPLLDYLDARGIPGPGPELRGSDALRETLDRLVRAGVAGRYDGGTSPVWSIRAGQHRVAAFYRNGALHHLVNRAVVELVLLGVATGAHGAPATPDPAADALERAWADALALRDLFKFEFFFPDKREFRDDVLAELRLLAEDWRDRAVSEQGAAELLASSRLLVAHRTLRSFVDAQFVVASRLLQRRPEDTVERDAFLTECLGVGEQLLLQGVLHRPDSVSSELYATALRLAEHRGLTEAGPGVGEGRAEFLAEIRGVLDRLGTLARIEDDVLTGVLAEVLR